MRWTAPPTRREISLVIFSLTVFALSYNIDTSIRLVGLNRRGAVLTRLGLGGSKAIGPDGRRTPGSRDALEKMIYGDWDWEADEIAGDGVERSQGKGVGRYGAMWIGKREVGPLTSKSLGETTVDQAFWRWEEAIPRSKVVKHVPGYTVIDNVILFNGTMTIVAEKPDSIPPLPHIIFSTSLNQWRIASPEQALDTLGPSGGRIRGVTWMAADSSPHNSTLLALWRTYSSLDPEIGPTGNTKLAPPRRLLFPYYTFFTDRNPEHADVTTRRQRAVNGIHYELVKAAFPFLTVMYFPDFEDYHKMEVPFVFERLVIADRTAARYAVEENEPIFASPFAMQNVSEHWWEPIRRTLATYFDVYGKKGLKKAVTYVNRQSQPRGLRLSDEDHTALVIALGKLERDYGYEVHIVSNVDDEMPWKERLGAIVRSTVMLGAHDGDLLDSAFMQRTPQTTLMEFFPLEKFAREQEIVARSLGMGYVAWWKDRQFSGDQLPPIARPKENEVVPIDVEAIIKAIRQILH